MKHKIYLMAVILLISISITAFAEDKLVNRYGIFAEYGLDQSIANFKKLPDIPNCCVQFVDGSGSGFTFGGQYQIPIDKRYGLLFRASLTNYSGVLKSTEPTSLVYFDSNIPNDPGTLKSGSFEHYLKGNFTSIGLDPLFYYNIIPKLKFNLGLRLAYNMTNTFEQKESVIGSFGEFFDGTNPVGRVRNKYSGDIPKASTLGIFALIGASYDLPMNKEKTLLLSPTAFYYLNFSKVAENTDWSINSLRIGLAVTYSPSDKKYLKEERRKIDTVYIQKSEIASKYAIGIEKVTTKVNSIEDAEVTLENYTRTDTIFTQKLFALDGTLQSVGVDSIGNEKDMVQFTIEEFISNRMQPLLPYIFFDYNSSVINNKYITFNNEKAREFEIKSLSKNGTLETYYQILNIVGRRMVEKPDATLRIVGCNSSVGAEQNNSDLSKQRAFVVKEYLVNNWQIAESRLILENRMLPETPSKPINDEEKIAENRRVEFYSSKYEILAPISLNDTLRISNPPIARFKLQSNAEAGLKNWELTATQKNAQTNSFNQTGTNILPPYVDWTLNANQKTIPNSNEQIEVNLNLVDTQGQLKNISSLLPLKYLSIRQKRKERILDKEINRYNLILFEFDKFDIKANNSKIIDLVKENLKDNSVVSITGYTDRTGEAQYNLKLSQNRANATKDALNHKLVIASGKGSNNMLFNNDIPEGRFYCRTVDILVETEVK